MPVRIILLETSTSLCSAALLEGDEITAVRHSGEPRAHASMTAPYVKEILDERGLKVSDCDAVCLSMGPGSYTGLRVGSSTAKGLCFGGGIPLLAVGTLDVLAAQAIEAGVPEGCEYIVPMIDARRMEVYTALYSADGQRLTEVAPQVVDSSFTDMLLAADAPGAPVRKGQSRSGGISTPATDGILFIGDGVKKVYKKLKKRGANVTMKLYTDNRHEVLNDTARDEVIADINRFLDGKAFDMTLV